MNATKKIVLHIALQCEEDAPELDTLMGLFRVCATNMRDFSRKVAQSRRITWRTDNTRNLDVDAPDFPY